MEYYLKTTSRFTLEKIVPDSWWSREILELTPGIDFAFYTQADESETEIKTPWLGHVSREFESRIESGNFGSGALFLEFRYFSTAAPAIFWVCGRTKMADLVMQSQLWLHQWPLMVFTGYLILLHSKTDTTFLKNQNYRPKKCWHPLHFIRDNDVMTENLDGSGHNQNKMSVTMGSGFYRGQQRNIPGINKAYAQPSYYSLKPSFSNVAIVVSLNSLLTEKRNHQLPAVSVDSNPTKNMTYFKEWVFFEGRVGLDDFLLCRVVVFLVGAGVTLEVFGPSMFVFWRDPDCSAVAGDGVGVDIGVLRPLDSLAFFVVGVLVVRGLSTKFDWMFFPISSGATLSKFNESLLMLYLRSSSCCRLVLSLKNAGGLVDGLICTSKAMDAPSMMIKTPRTTKRYFCIGTANQWYKKPCSPHLIWQLLCWSCWETADLDCDPLLRISGTCWSNVLFGSSYIAKSESLELGDGFCEVEGLLSNWTSIESSSSCIVLLVESSITSEEDEVDECCSAGFLSFPDRNWTMSSVKQSYIDNYF